MTNNKSDGWFLDNPVMHGMLTHMLTHQRSTFARNQQARAAIQSIQQESRFEGRHDERVADLLTALQAPGIKLRPDYGSRLQQLPYDQLPSIQAALASKSEQDFAVRANLILDGAASADGSDV